MWKKSDSKRFVPTDIGQRFRSAAFHDPAHDRAQRQGMRRGVHLDGYGQSQIGGARRINQDQFFTVPLESDSGELNCFLGVADGGSFGVFKGQVHGRSVR